MRQHGPRRFRPEVDFLLACARAEVAARSDGFDAGVEVDILDWDAVLGLARRHRLEPILWRRFTDGGISAPPPAGAELRETIDALVGRNLYMIAELADVIDRLGAAGLRVLTYKGPSLAALAYGDGTRREFDDLDLLVPAEDFPEAVAILRSGDYVAGDSFPAFGELSLVKPEPELHIDLHHRVTPARYPFAFAFDDLWERRIDVAVSGRTVQTFGLEDLLSVVAVHATRHHWMRLEWLVGFAALVHSGRINWVRLLRRANQGGYDRMILLGLRLSEELLGFPLPARLPSNIADDLFVELSVNRVISHAFREQVDYATDNRRFHYERYLVQFMLMRGFRARGTYGMRLGQSLLSNKLDSMNFVFS